MKATKKFSLRRIVRWERDFSQIFVRIALPIAIQNMVAASAHIVDGLMIARGAMGNPWLFGQIKAQLEGREYTVPTIHDRIDMALRHYDMLLEWKSEYIAVREMRKHIGWYISGARGAAQMRERINQIEDHRVVREVLREFEQDASKEA